MMECSIPVTALEQEHHQQTRSDPPVTALEGRDSSGLTDSTAPDSRAVVGSAEPAVVLEVSPGADSSKKDDDGRNAQNTKGRKVTFVAVKEMDIDMEKGVGVVDAGEGVGGQGRVEDDAETVCRVCHLSSDNRSGPADLIQIGCGCKDDLGIAHRYCAEAWFKIKGNRSCEICGEIAKNVVGAGDTRFMEEWNDRDATPSSPSETARCWRGQPLCNFLMACMVIAFILPWFFRVSMF